MSVKTLAALLLTGQVLSVAFIFLVIRRQLSLFRLYINPELKSFRLMLFLLATVIFVGNIIPVAIDILTVIDRVHRSTSHTNIIGVAYSLSNTITATLSALLIWILYRVAAKTVLIVEHDKDVAFAKKNNS